jgi:hypothetical protein
MRETTAVCLFLSAMAQYLHLRNFSIHELEEALINPRDNPLLSAILSRLLIKDRTLRAKLSVDEGFGWPQVGVFFRETIHSWYMRREHVWKLVENSISRTRSTLVPTASGSFERVLGGKLQNEMRQRLAMASEFSESEIQTSLIVPVMEDILYTEKDARNKLTHVQLLPRIKEVPLPSIKRLGEGQTVSTVSQSVLPIVSLPSVITPGNSATAASLESFDTADVTMSVDPERTITQSSKVDTITTLKAKTTSTGRALSSKQRVAGQKRKETDPSSAPVVVTDQTTKTTTTISSSIPMIESPAILTPSKKGASRKKNNSVYVFPLSRIPDHAPGLSLQLNSSLTLSEEYLSDDYLERIATGQSVDLSSSFSFLPPSSFSSTISSTSDSTTLSPFSSSQHFTPVASELYSPTHAQTRASQVAQAVNRTLETSLVEIHKEDLKKAHTITNQDVSDVFLDTNDEADEEDVAEAYEWDALLEPLGAEQDPLSRMRFVDAPLKLRMTLLQTLIDGRIGDWNDDLCQFLINFADEVTCSKLRLRVLGKDGNGGVFYTYPSSSFISFQEIRIFRETIYRVPTSGRMIRTWDPIATDFASLETLITELGPLSKSDSGTSTTGAEKDLIQALYTLRDLHKIRIDKEEFRARKKAGIANVLANPQDAAFEAEEEAEQAKEIAAKEAAAAKAAAIERARLQAEHEAIIAAESLANTRKRRSSVLKNDAAAAAAAATSAVASSEAKAAKSEAKAARNELHRPYSGPTSVSHDKLLQIMERLPHRDKVIAIQHVLRLIPEHDRYVIMPPNALPLNYRFIAAPAKEYLQAIKDKGVERERGRLHRIDRENARKRRELEDIEKARLEKENFLKRSAELLTQGRGERATRRDGGISVSDQLRMARQQEAAERRSILTSSLESAKQVLVTLREKMQENFSRLAHFSAPTSHTDANHMARVSQELQATAAENLGLTTEINLQVGKIQEAENALKIFEEHMELFVKDGSDGALAKMAYMDFVKRRNDFLTQPSNIRIRLKLQVPLTPINTYLGGYKALHAFPFGSPWIDKAIENMTALHPGLKWIRGEIALRSGIPSGQRSNLVQANATSNLITQSFLGDGAASGKGLEEPPKNFLKGTTISSSSSSSTSKRGAHLNHQGSRASGHFLSSPSLITQQSDVPVVPAVIIGDRFEPVTIGTGTAASTSSSSGHFLKLKFNSSIRPPPQQPQQTAAVQDSIEHVAVQHSVEPIEQFQHSSEPVEQVQHSVMEADQVVSALVSSSSPPPSSSEFQNL